jgi:hypothetical protein
MSMRTILGVLVSAVLVVGCAGAAGTQAPAASSPSTQAPAASASGTQAPATSTTPRASGAFGGVAKFQLDGSPATTEINAVADGASVSGTAVTTFHGGIHTVRLGCATQGGGTWVVGGTVETTTVHGESAGAWSAVIVKDGSPPQIGIWLSADPADASDCEAWLASFDPAELFREADPGTFNPLESGTLVPPPASAP